MPKFVIERNLTPGHVPSDAEIQAKSLKSLEVLRELGPEIQWIESFVTDDKIYCIYSAPDERLIMEHARRGGLRAVGWRPCDGYWIRPTSNRSHIPGGLVCSRSARSRNLPSGTECFCHFGPSNAFTVEAAAGAEPSPCLRSTSVRKERPGGCVERNSTAPTESAGSAVALASGQ